MIKFDNSLKIVEDFHSCYSDKPKAEKLATLKNKRKKS